jgi:cyclase
MALKRVIPLLLLKDGGLVKTVKFKNPSYVGDPINAVRIFNDKEVDELLVLNIGWSQSQDIPLNYLKKMASECFMPLAYGGGVKKLSDFQKIYECGIEKVSVNTLVFDNPQAIRQAVNQFGSSSVIGSVDVKKNWLGQNKVYNKHGKTTKLTVVDHCKYLVEELGVGELIVTSVNQEGTWAGFELELYEQLLPHVNVPVIASGGAGNIEDLKSALYELGANAVAIGSMAVYSRKGQGVLINMPSRNQIIIDEYDEID